MHIKKNLALLLFIILILSTRTAQSENMGIPSFDEIGDKINMEVPTVQGQNIDSACSVEEPCKNTLKKKQKEKLKSKFSKLFKSKKPKKEDLTFEEDSATFANEPSDISKNVDTTTDTAPAVDDIKNIESTIVTENHINKNLSGKEQLKEIVSTKKINITKYLKLSNEQIKSAQQNRKYGEEQIAPYLKDIKTIERKIENIEFENKANEARDVQVKYYRNIIDEINQKADIIRKENEENFKQILTPEQLDLYEDIMQKQHVNTLLNTTL